MWFDDAKLGIFVHWGLYSVPAWAPPTGELNSVDWSKWFANNPYAEWYLNTLRIKGSPTYKHHIETYGANYDYYRFAEAFNESTKKWRPEEWAATFQKAGARYVVLTTKHHDGFRLWPSKVTNPHADAVKITAQRNLVGELTSAVRAKGMRMGLYYSGGLDWTFTSAPITTREELMQRVPQSGEYARYADAHWRELIEEYQPAVLWNDISYPKVGQTREIFSEYYNRVPDGVVNNRFGVDFADYTTPEYAKYDRITEKKWESCRGLGFSFGYNQVEGPQEVIAADKLIALLVDIVSKNGNLLLNVGPKPDGSIPAIQLDRLEKLGTWLAANGDGVFGSKPWTRPAAKSVEGREVRFTQQQQAGGGGLNVFLLGSSAGGTATIPGLRLDSSGKTKARLLGGGDASVGISQDGSNIVLRLPDERLEYAVSVRLEPAPRAV